jgi:hypothetical protein
MKKHPDGSRTLSKEEFTELCIAYVNLRDIMGGQPAYLGDYFMGGRNRERINFVQVEKWYALLNSHTFTRAEEKELLGEDGKTEEE